MFRLLVRFTFFFHFPECVTLMNVRHYGKVIERRWRRGRPLQRTATPRVASQVTVLVAVANRNVHLNNEAENTQRNHFLHGTEAPKLLEIRLEPGTFAYPKTCLGEPIHNQQPYIPKDVYDRLMDL